MKSANSCLPLKIIPNASKNAIIGWEEKRIKVRIAAPPEKERANKTLIDFLAKQLKIPKSNLKLLRGHTGRLKTVEVANLSLNACLERLSLSPPL